MPKPFANCNQRILAFMKRSLDLIEHGFAYHVLGSSRHISARLQGQVPGNTQGPRQKRARRIKLFELADEYDCYLLKHVLRLVKIRNCREDESGHNRLRFRPKSR